MAPAVTAGGATPNAIGSVLIANRGEIAVRVARTLARLGLRACAVATDVDARAAHARAADVTARVASYLDAEAIVAAARRCGADAVHPGYGFLAESAHFARAVADAGMVWIGPPADAIAALGDKITAKQLAAEAGVPVVPGVHQAGLDDDALAEAAGDLGVPLLVKAAAGGGGKGMRRVDDLADLPAALAAARREAATAFGSDELLLERLVERPRHLEVQILGDTHGAVVHLGERECSLQRRHQKIIEEAPSPVVGGKLRDAMGADAVALAERVGYVGAGTVEFVAPADEPAGYRFLEANTRLQVEHPVTEAVTGFDLVEWQVRVAAGEPLDFDQSGVRVAGHAVEARVYAEDPARGFLPTGGPVHVADLAAAGCRVDAGVAAGDVVSSDYDPLLAKIIAHGRDRPGALQLLDRGLGQVHLLGFTTNVAFLRRLLVHPDVAAGELDTGLVERERAQLAAGAGPDHHVLVAAACVRRLSREPTDDVGDPFAARDGWRVGETAWTPLELVWEGGTARVDVRGPLEALEVRVDGGAPEAVSTRRDGDCLVCDVGGLARRLLVADVGDVVWLGRDGCTWAVRERPPLAAARTAASVAEGPLRSPMPGTVAEVAVAVGDEVADGQALLVVEAMKMHHPVTAPRAGRVAALHVAVGDRVTSDQPLVELSAPEKTGQDGL